LLPAPVSPIVYQLTRRLALSAHRALGCRGVSRADFRYDDRIEGTGGLVCLEVNTQPGMTETSLVPELAAHPGITFDELVRWMVEDASLSRGPGPRGCAGARRTFPRALSSARIWSAQARCLRVACCVREGRCSWRCCTLRCRAAPVRRRPRS